MPTRTTWQVPEWCAVIGREPYFQLSAHYQDEVCDKDLLLDIGWLGRPISPNSLNVAIANIRRHFASSPQTLDIRSTPKKGIPFI